MALDTPKLDRRWEQKQTRRVNSVLPTIRLAQSSGCFQAGTIISTLFLGKLGLSEGHRQPKATPLVKSEPPESWCLLEMACEGAGGSRARGVLRSGRWPGPLFQKHLAPPELS